MRRRTGNDKEDLQWFLTEVAEGRCEIELWNEFAIGSYKDSEIESIRKQLYEKALFIGQCSAIPFPPPLCIFASELQEEF